MVLLKPSALLKSSKPRPQQQQGFSESLIGDSVDAVDAFISQWVSPHQNDSSSSSCILSSLFSAQNRLEGRRFLEVLGRLQYAIQSTVVVNPGSAKLAQGQDLMRKAMKHLEKEFYRVMKSNSRFLDPESVSGWSSESNTSSTRSSVNASDSSSSDDNELDSESSSELGIETRRFGESDAIVDLKMIANCMISSGYEKDCVKIYKKFRKKIIADALTRLGFEKLTSTQMQKLDWETLEKKIKVWVRVTTVAITTLFNGERILSDHIFSSVSVAESCFVEITLQSALSLFIFSLTIAKSKKTAEKIFPTLDVYQTILNLIPKIDQIFSYDSTASVRSQAAESLEKLSESVNAMMTEFQTSITKESSKSAIPGGGVHQLTRYVMNFIVFLADYSDSLATILKESSLPLPEDYFSSSGEENPGSGGRSPMAARLAWLVLVLLCKIDAKSRLYNDSALSYLFLANNLHYVVTKVRTSNLRIVLGDDWVTNHEVKVTQYLEKYEKKAWGDVIASLPGDTTAEAKAEEALRRFNEAFEEAYKKHKTWVVPDPKLRGEIQASVASKLMPGYTGFYKKYPVGSWKIVIFTPEDLNNYITDLYIGLGRSVPVSKTHKYVVASHVTTDVKHCSM
ncbi:PREDICTED: exocyst complex component EXO70B1-like [Camelina sativa]|uniref:Exocyst subunit Exo70 family protein n=1 Tax=Camelina sativa TaxID=90675 RepID=A0ABM0XM11_CAMSA|nr:PREDICTED: exocyst complex component EXO70B1-like [Camelina sativa]